MKWLAFTCFCFTTSCALAQEIDSIYVNLYTDSLKRGTFNYINIDGLLQNGRYLPLDSTHLQFHSSAGYFKGNSLWIDPDFTGKMVDIGVTLRRNPALSRQFSLGVKQMPDGPLKSLDELMQDMENGRKSKKNTRNNP